MISDENCSHRFTGIHSLSVSPRTPSTEEARRRRVDCVHRIRYRSSQNQSRALAYQAPILVQRMGSTSAVHDARTGSQSQTRLSRMISSFKTEANPLQAVYGAIIHAAGRSTLRAWVT